MNENRMTLPAYPLIANDPYFSIWDMGYLPTSDHTRHWSGAEKRLMGKIFIDSVPHRFLGAGTGQAMKLEERVVTPLTTRYVFSASGVRLTLSFTSPLLPDDRELFSTPITFVRFGVEFTDGKEHRVILRFSAHEHLTYSGEVGQNMRFDSFSDDALKYAYLGKMQQSPLNGSGDHLTIDWGYLFFAASQGVMENDPAFNSNVLTFRKEASAPFEATLLVGYDDIASIQYFNSFLPGWWARDGKTIVEALREFAAKEDQILSRCDAFDRELISEAENVGGEDLALLVAASYRQSVAAHKTVCDRRGRLLFISKENDSNGCAATADVSYPSIPLFLLYDPELVRGMLRPVFDFARQSVWTYDFAPHDVGRYPILTGQEYGSKLRNKQYGQGSSAAPYYLYPATVDAYRMNRQMPVEECGNMILMTWATVFADGDTALAEENLDLLRKWCRYLIEFGPDPENQLCTDDFAGHLARNVNLSAKAFLGTRAFAEILEKLGEKKEADLYRRKAKEMAESWLKRAFDGTHSALTFEGVGWSQKYNLVWDKVYSWGLLPDTFYESELESYLPRILEFGLPLDSRTTASKTDWTLWVASMARDKKTFSALVSPLVHYLRERRSPVPFGDYYDAATGTRETFMGRSVQGGIFMPLLRKRWNERDNPVSPN